MALAVSGEAARSKTARTRAIARAVQEVALYLGTTPGRVPRLVHRPAGLRPFRDGPTIGGALEELGDVEPGEPATQGAVEEAVLDLIERDLDSDALERVSRAAA